MKMQGYNGSQLWDCAFAVQAVVGRCRLNPVEARLERDWHQCLKLKYDELLSSFAFNFNLRRCTVAATGLAAEYKGCLQAAHQYINDTQVGRCRSILSIPR